MKRKEKPINEYLELICSLLIDQFNVRYEHFSFPKRILKKKQMKDMLRETGFIR